MAIHRNKIKNRSTPDGEVNAMSYNRRLTDERVISEVKKYMDRVPIAVFRGENSTVIVSVVISRGEVVRMGEEGELCV